jgi:autotransporter passenger strand-loop-strand repeat protein
VIVSSGQIEIVSSGQNLLDAVVLSGGSLMVLAGGSTSGTTVSGGQEVVSSGGTTDGSTVDSGGTEVLSAGAIASNVTVSSGGGVSGPGLLAGGQDTGLVDGVTISGSLQLLAHGEVDGATLLSGGYVSLFGGVVVAVGNGSATASGSIIGSGAEEYLYGPLNSSCDVSAPAPSSTTASVASFAQAMASFGRASAPGPTAVTTSATSAASMLAIGHA